LRLLSVKLDRKRQKSSSIRTMLSRVGLEKTVLLATTLVLEVVEVRTLESGELGGGVTLEEVK